MEQNKYKYILSDFLFFNNFKNSELKESELIKLSFFGKIQVLMLRLIPALIALILLATKIDFPTTDYSYFAMGFSIIFAFLILVFIKKNDKNTLLAASIVMLLLLVISLSRVRLEYFNINLFAGQLMVMTAYFYILFLPIKDVFIESDFLRFYSTGKKGIYVFKPRVEPLSIIRKIVAGFFIIVFFLLSIWSLITAANIYTMKIDTIQTIIKSKVEKKD